MIEIRPEPVLHEARIAGRVTSVLTALLALVAVLGITMTSADASALTGAVVAIVGGVVMVANYVIPLVRAERARALVTPLTSPMDDSDAPLVPRL